MADFSIPFANGASADDRRYPTVDEKVSGFLCGPADRALFNGVLHRIESELQSIISEAGIPGDDTAHNRTLLAIQAMIEAALATIEPPDEPDLSPFLTMLQARARLPIFPEVLNVDGRIVVTAPATGTIRLPGGVTFMHRGIFPVTTVQTDFATDASKTYHLRWNPTDGYVLRDLASGTYNPSTLAETDPSFDSTYDDMLIARIITNSSNVAMITNLANKARFLHRDFVETGAEIYTSGGGNDGVRLVNTFSLNFARTPTVIFTGYAGQMGGGAYYISAMANAPAVLATSRYSTQGSVSTDFITSVTGTPIGNLNLIAIS